jgi:mitochondrial enoyl-[acyl-carrier protein] reductase / trans-2-enoyl-CoA reductase
VKNLAAVYAQNGSPSEILKLESRHLREPEPDQVLIRMLRAPINPSDINMLEGTYGVKVSLPAVAGNEGVGCVEKVGSKVTKLKTGQMVRPATGTGTWQQWALCPASDCLIFPEDLSPEQAAMLYVNPATAWRMLHDFLDLKPGDWIIQNASNSGVGRSVIQIAKSLGLRTINLVRRIELIDELKAIGADSVLLDHPDSLSTIQELTGLNAPHLALNAVGGDSVNLLCKSVASGAKIVNYGAMSKQPLRIGNGLLIFKDLSFYGYWVSRWYKQASEEKIESMFSSLANLCRENKLLLPIAASYPLEEVLAAVVAAQKDKRDGKIMLHL